MKFLSFMTENGPHFGALLDSGVADLTETGLAGSLSDVILGGDETIQRIEQAAASGRLDTVPEHSLTYAKITDEPVKILCVGLNYKSHAEETGGEAPKQPVFFCKFSDTLAAAGHPVKLPEWQRCFDYEGELVVIIGKRCYHVSREEAMDHVFGYTVGNDLSARDCQFLSNQWLTGKSFPDFAPAGPVVVTKDEFDPSLPHAVRTVLNGKVVQSGSTDDMIFSIPEIVEHASRYFELKPGDLIFTGTPAGVILGHPKGQREWMKPGDTVIVEIEGICALETPLI